MKTLIVGSEGSMGKRYQAILKYLNKEFLTADIDDSMTSIFTKAQDADNIIIATPTATHVDFLLMFEKLQIPILCEKPLATHPHDLKEIRWLSQRGVNLTMMMQYEFFDDKVSCGLTSYDFFRHGNDSLPWDCIQIIGLARGEIKLNDTSPIWNCQLNGRRVSLDYMDLAYVSSVDRWFKNPGMDVNYLLDIHEKVRKYATSKP